MRTLLASLAAGLFALGVTQVAEAQKGGRGGNGNQGQRQGQANKGQGKANQTRTRDLGQLGTKQVGVDRQPGADVSVTRQKGKGGAGKHFPGDGHNHKGDGNWKHFPGDGHNHNWNGNWGRNWHYPGDGHNHNWYRNNGYWRNGRWYPNNYWNWFGNNWRWYGNNWRWLNNNWRWYGSNRYNRGYGYPYYGSYYGGYYDYPYYTDSSYYTDYDSTANAPPPNPAPDQAIIHVILPDANAKVVLNGQEVPSSGNERDFFSPRLELGRQYSYTVTASWYQGSRPVSDTRVVVVNPGQVSVVDFTRPASTLAPAPRY